MSDDTLPRMGSRGEYPLHELMYGDYGVGEDAEKSSLYKSAAAIAGTGLSALYTIANVLDKPRAAVSGLMAYAGSGKTEALNNVLFLLPFSESYLKSTYERLLGTKIPDKHISGRDVLVAWGAEPNRPGFHPIRDPQDAILDTLGLALEVASVPPIGPAVGTLTKRGAETLGKVGTLDFPRFFQAVGQIKEVPASLRAAINTAEATAEGSVEWYASLMRHNKIADDIIDQFRTAAKSVMTEDSPFPRLMPAFRPEVASEQLRTVFQNILIEKALQGGRVIPRTGIGEKVREIEAGERALISIKPTWPLQGDAVYEFTGPTAAKVARALVDNPLTRFTRHLFDWTAKGMFYKSSQQAAERATDLAMQIQAAVHDVTINTDGVLASLADQYAKLAQVNAFAGNVGAVATFDDMVRYIVETAREGRYSVGDTYEKLFQNLFGSQQVSDDAAKFVKDVASISAGSLGRILDRVHQHLGDVGIPVGTVRDYMVGYFPRYANPAEFAEKGRLEEFLFGGSANIEGVGKLLSPGKRRTLSKRRYALKNVFGGTVAVDMAAMDHLLAKPTQFGSPNLLSPVFKTNDGLVLKYGDYVVHNGALGRFAGVSTKTHDPMWLRLGEETAEVMPTEGVRRTMPPRGVDIKLYRLRYDQANLGMRQWLEASGVDISRELAIKNANEMRRAIRRRYLLEAVIRPFVEQDSPLAKLLHVLPDDADDALREALKQARKLYREEQLPKISKRTWSMLERLVKEDGGLLGPLADYLEEKAAGRLFTNGVLDDFYLYMKSAGNLISAVSGVYRGLATSAVVRAPGQAPAGYIPMMEAFTRLSIRMGKSERPLEINGVGALLKTMASERPEIMREAAKFRRDIRDVVFVPESSVKILQGMLDSLVPGNESRMFIEEAANTFTKMATSWMTLPRLSFHLRNYVSQTAMGLLGDAPYTPAQYMANHKETLAKLISGEVDQIKYADEIRNLDFLGRNHFVSLEDTAGRVKSTLAPAREVIAPLKNRSISDLLKSSVQFWRIPFAQSEKQPNVILDVGRRAFDFTEAATRIPVYQAARDAGLRPSEAQEVVRRLLYDYTRQSPFEKRFARQGLLFYGWLRNNLPAMFVNTALRWTTGQARLLHGFGRLSSASTEGEPVPTWLADTMPVVLPWKDPEGRSLVVRQFGLPIQDLSLISPDLANLHSRFYAQSHPFIKTAYKLATGRDPYTQMPIRVRESALERAGVKLPREVRVGYRLLEDLIPLTPLINQFATTFVDTAPPLAKVIDAATGIKIDVYDIKKLGYLDITKKLERYLSSRPEVAKYETVYIPEKEQSEGITPETARAYDVYRQIRKERSKEYRERKLSELFPSPLPVGIGL